jgi:S1-C subfamily serine protease
MKFQIKLIFLFILINKISFSQIDMSFPENTGYDVSSLKDYLDVTDDPFEGIYSYRVGDRDAGFAIIKDPDNDGSYIEVSLSEYIKTYVDPQTCKDTEFRKVYIGDIDGYLTPDLSFENVNDDILIWETYSNDLLNSSFTDISMTKHKAKFSKNFSTVSITDITKIPDTYGKCLSPKKWYDKYIEGRKPTYELKKIYPNSKSVGNSDRVKKNKKKDDWKGNGSGLIISKLGHIVTNYHVIENASSIEIEYKNEQGLKSYKATVSVIDEANDLAIIKITDDGFDEFESTPNYNFDTDVSNVGSKVFVYGYPLALNLMGKEIKVTDGMINSKTGIQGDVKSYQISNPIQPGNSGGPLFNDNGSFIGVITSGLKKEVADNVAYSTKSSYVMNLISSLDEKIDLPSSYTIRFLSTEKQIKKLSEYVVLIKIK